jgi:hypothetical protein
VAIDSEPRTRGLSETVGGGTRRPLALCLEIGALWGLVAYRILWGDTSIVITRRFVDSAPGLAALLPVRIVLFAIHVIEDHVIGHPLQLPTNHGWIGAASALAGATLGLAAYLGGRGMGTLTRASRAHARRRFARPRFSRRRL